MKELSPNDEAIVRALRKANVLQDIAGHMLDQREGVILVTCPDGDHFFDIFSRQLEMQEGQCDKRIHTFGWHGGSIRLAANSPANKRPDEHQIFLEEIRDARTIKGINTVALYAHAVCGKADVCNIDFLHLMHLHLQAKAAVKAMNDGISVACFLHITYPDMRRRTYFVSRPDWGQWIGPH